MIAGTTAAGLWLMHGVAQVNSDYDRVHVKHHLEDNRLQSFFSAHQAELPQSLLIAQGIMGAVHGAPPTSTHDGLAKILYHLLVRLQALHLLDNFLQLVKRGRWRHIF